MSSTRWEQIGAAGGIVFVVLQMAAQSLMQVGGAEPPFNAPADTIAAFFTARDSQLFALGEYLSTLSLIAFLWFLGSLWSALRRSESEPAWLSLVALASGLMVVAIAGAGMGWPLAVFRKNEGLEPQIARLLFDQGNFAFANVWVMLASLSLATGVVSIRTGALPRWLGWAGVLIAVGLLAARAAWAGSALVFVPFLLCYLWLIAISVVLIRRASVGQPAARMPAVQHS
ncbi:MAG TPA: hypothetical protein VFT99_01695 [Roseiflexaceae bacterium]|nr:hypothetical protein [Roseiflexaceae bacterium]